VTLRARLTAGFLAVVLGPVLLGAIAVGMMVAAVNRDRAAERLDLAAAAVRAALDGTCQRLRVAAESTALLTGGRADAALVRPVVDRKLAAGVRLVGADGAVRYITPGLPPGAWADCAGGPSAGYGAIFARVQLRDLGYADAVEPVDGALVQRLASAAHAAVTVLPPTGTATLTTDRTADLTEVARRAPPDRMVDAGDGRRLCRLAPGPGQPLPLVISIEQDYLGGLYAVLVGVVVLAGLLAVAAAWWLARTTTGPLTELSDAVERMAAGDLAARVPVRGQDEIGRLGQTFNRMAHGTQAYVRALTASRDQLRGHLGLLGDTLSSTHDLDRILQVIVQTALAATGAQAGILLLVDPAQGLLVSQCGEGLAERSAETDVRVPLGEGLLGSVATSGEARRGRVDRDGPMLSPGEPRCRTYLAVPFGDTEETEVPAARGVLALYDRHGFDDFDEADVATLRTFAGQAAVALDNVRVHEQAQRLSLADPLTGLSNYRYLKESMRREVARASRFGRMLAVVAVDLDRFREVNEAYGHPAGDAVLAEIARRLRAEIREVDLAFRYGGEEFVVLLPETDADGAAVLAQRVGAAVRRTPVSVAAVQRPPEGAAQGPSEGAAQRQPEGAAQPAEPARIAMTVSIGIAVYPDHGATGQCLLRAADDALHAAKAAGRDTYRVAEPDPAAGPADDCGATEVTPAAGPADDCGATAATPAAGPAGPQPARPNHGG
jgi:diguanylate cyclase (GGDEF)-like protein